MAKMTKKKITDLVAYTTLLLHNDDYSDVITEEQIEKMTEFHKSAFKSDEQLALGFIKTKVKSLVDDLEEELSDK